MDLRELELTAELAHFNLGKDQLAALFPAFTQMTGFFDTMREADNDAAFTAMLRNADENAAQGAAQNQPHTGGKSYPVAGALYTGSAQHRGDEDELSAPAADISAEGGGVREKMLAAAGERDGNFIVIPNVL